MREAIPTFNPSTAVPIALAALLPAIRNAQVALDRARSTNNLKQIGLAFHNFHETNNHFPADIRSKDGKPLLSWRVAILPFLGQGELFNEFRQDEPWDSPHNKALIAQMPAVFAIAGETAPQPGHTFYRGFSGAGAMFDPKVPKASASPISSTALPTRSWSSKPRKPFPGPSPDSDLAFEDDQNPEKVKANARASGRALRRRL